MKKVICVVSKFVYFFAGFFVILSMHAHAYIDPSAVTYGVQAAAAVVVAIGAVFTIFRHKIAAFFKKGKKEEKAEIHFEDDENEETKEAVETVNEAASEEKNDEN